MQHASQAKSLRTLHLDLSNLLLGDLGGFAEHLKKATSLRALTLVLRDNHGIQPAHASALAGALKDLSVLETLNLALDGTHIGTEGVQALATNLQVLQHLRFIRLSLARIEPELRSEAVHAIGVWLQQATELRLLGLDLSENFICDKGVRGYGTALAGLPKLAHLWLNFYKNSLSSIACLAFAFVAAKWNPPLRNGRVQSPLTEGLIPSRPVGVCPLKTLYLDLRCNAIGDIGAKAFNKTLRHAPMLYFLRLDLQCNYISQWGADQFISVQTGLVAKLQETNPNLILQLGVNIDRAYQGPGPEALQRPYWRPGGTFIRLSTPREVSSLQVGRGYAVITDPTMGPRVPQWVPLPPPMSNGQHCPTCNRDVPPGSYPPDPLGVTAQFPAGSDRNPANAEGPPEAVFPWW